MSGIIDEPVSEPGIALLPTARECASDPRTLRRVIAALGGGLGAIREPAGMADAGALPRREGAALANVRRGPVCAACGMTDPPAERTCKTGGLLLDHYVGLRDGCPGCGRLRAACDRDPCSAKTGVFW